LITSLSLLTDSQTHSHGKIYLSRLRSLLDLSWIGADSGEARKDLREVLNANSTQLNELTLDYIEYPMYDPITLKEEIPGRKGLDGSEQPLAWDVLDLNIRHGINFPVLQS